MTTVPDRLRTVAVVLAGGTGSRVGLDIPKQLLKVAGRTIIEHTVEALHDCDEIDEIVVVMAPDFVAGRRASCCWQADVPQGLTRVLAGGRDRNESTRSAARRARRRGVQRPVPRRRAPAAVAGAWCRTASTALRTYEAVDVAIPSADTIVRVDDDEHIVEIPDRSLAAPRPDAAGLPAVGTIRRAYEIAADDPDFARHRRLRRGAALPARGADPRRAAATSRT